MRYPQHTVGIPSSGTSSSELNDAEWIAFFASNQVHLTSPFGVSFAGSISFSTVMSGPPDFKRTVSPTLKFMGAILSPAQAVIHSLPNGGDEA